MKGPVDERFGSAVGGKAPVRPRIIRLLAIDSIVRESRNALLRSAAVLFASILFIITLAAAVIFTLAWPSLPLMFVDIERFVNDADVVLPLWRFAMMHFTCDRCQRPIDPTDSLRYVVRIDVRARMECADFHVDDDGQDDHLLELDELLQQAEELEDGSVSPEIAQQLRFDLCPTCYRAFARNPLARPTPHELQYSDN